MRWTTAYFLGRAVSRDLRSSARASDRRRRANALEVATACYNLEHDQANAYDWFVMVKGCLTQACGLWAISWILFSLANLQNDSAFKFAGAITSVLWVIGLGIGSFFLWRAQSRSTNKTDVASRWWVLAIIWIPTLIGATMALA